MVSCTEFIPLYSELFKFLEKCGGKEEVIKYWKVVSEKYVEPRLGEELKKNGLKGCFNYWNVSLNEEACDFTMTYDGENNYFEIDMRGCPSRGMLNALPHTEPYPDYCGHCDLLYSSVAKKYGIEIKGDFTHVDKARCKFTATKK